MKRDVDKMLSRINPVSRAAIEGPALAIGDELIASIVTERREPRPARPAASSRWRIAAGWRITGRRASRVVAAGFACLALGGTAMAATGVWDPVIGSAEIDGPVSTSATPVPQDITEALGVLRRDPTAGDHSAEVEATLREVAFADGVRPDSVRFLAPGERGEATIVLSAKESSMSFEEPEPVCVFRPGVEGYWHQDNAFSNCVGLPALLSGRGYGENLNFNNHTGLAFGLVPDGVASVTAEFPNAPDVTVPVADNYFEIPLSGSEVGNYVEESGPNATGEGLSGAGISQVRWQDAGGAPVAQQPDQKYGKPGAPNWVEGNISAPVDRPLEKSGGS
jgi:hypothetical protein